MIEEEYFPEDVLEALEENEKVVANHPGYKRGLTEEEQLAACKRWRQRNREKVKATCKKYRQENKEKVAAYWRSERGKEVIKRYQTSEKGKATSARYYKKNKVEILRKCRERYRRKKEAEDGQ